MTHHINEATRRAVLRAAAGAVGAAAGVGAGAAHPGNEGNSEDHDRIDGEPDVEATETVGYHSLGGIGSESLGGDADSPHYGAATELILHEGRGLAFVGFFSSRAPTEDRGLAVIDVSSYLGAETAAAVDTAEMTVLSFLRNDNPASAVMDVNPSDDGEYVFICKQSVTALFNAPRGVGTRPGADGEDASPQGDSLQAVDVSDPGNPRVVATWDLWGGLGPHNANYHRIGNSEYVFACKGATVADAGVYVFEFDRTTETLREVNFYTLSGNAAQGSPGPNDGSGVTPAYSHDIVVQNDPIEGTPVGYWANFGQGAWLLDVSDPTDIQPLGYTRADDAVGDAPDSFGAHYVEPSPTLVDGKRVFVIGEEISRTSGGRSGYYLLADADPAFEEDGLTKLPVMDDWALLEEGAEFSNFTLSPHNCDIDDEGRVAAGHYHAGTRFFEIDGGELREAGHHREPNIVPEESEGAVSQATPFHWTSELANGLAFSSGINTGVYVYDNDALEVGRNPIADVDIERFDGSDVYGSGWILRLELDVDADSEVRVRDRLPADWTVYGGEDDFETHEAGGAQYVEFTDPVAGRETRAVLAEVGGDGGSFTVGPAEYSSDGGDTWRGVPDTVDANLDVGLNTRF